MYILQIANKDGLVLEMMTFLCRQVMAVFVVSRTASWVVSIRMLMFLDLLAVVPWGVIVSPTRLNTPDLAFSVARKELVYTSVKCYYDCPQN